VKLALVLPPETVPDVTGEPIVVLLLSLIVKLTVPASTVEVLVTVADNATV
jgi:hypothetical protein